MKARPDNLGKRSSGSCLIRVTIVEQPCVLVDFSGYWIDKVSTAHSRGCVRAGSRRRVDRPRNIVGHIVAECVLLELGLASVVVEQVLAGK